MSEPLKNKTILITAGPTREAMDPVRFLTNASSGSVGIEIAKAARKSGARVILVLGPTHLNVPSGIKTIRVTSALEMNSQVKRYLKTSRVFVSSAAVGDWRFKMVSPQKLKKGKASRMRVTLVRNPDILAHAGAVKKRRKDLILVGFALETKNQLAEAKKKLLRKNLDLIVANGPRSFSSGKIKSTWIDRKHTVMRLPEITKAKFSKKLVEWMARYDD